MTAPLRLRWRLRGSGSETVVLLHGQLWSGEIFEPLANRLATRHRVLIPDLPGHGASAHVDAGSLARIQALLEADLAAHGIRRASLVGFSLGTYHALGLAIGKRIEVARLALVGPVAGHDRSVKAQFASLAAQLHAGVDLTEALVASMHAPQFALAHPEAVARTRAVIAAASRETLAVELEAVASCADLRETVSTLRCPVLLRVGALDQATPPIWAEELSQRIPGAHLEVVPDAGHHLFEEDPWTLARIEEFLLA